MDRESVREVLRTVLGPSEPLVNHTKWVNFRCPLAPWTHARGTDSSPSAGISINDDGVSIFHCYSCLEGGKGPVAYLLRQLEKYCGDDYSALIREIEGNDYLGGPLAEWGVKKEPRQKLNVLDEKVWLDMFDPITDHSYLRERNVSLETARYLGLRLDPSDSVGIPRIVFPVYTPRGHLVGFTGRATLPNREPKVRDYYGLKKELVMLGSHLVREDDPYVVVVEGLFDYAVLAEYGYPAVAALHAGLTEEQRDVLLDIGKPVILMYDNDDAGRKGQEVAAEALLGRVPVSVARYPKVKGGLCAKDPAGLSAGTVDRMIEKAALV